VRNGVTARTTSFGRAPRTRRASHAGYVASSIRAVTVFKTAGEALGMTLAKPGVDGLAVEGEGVLVSRIARGGAVAKSKRITPGDTICAVNGLSCLDYRHCAELLRSADGLIQSNAPTGRA
jgi:C-terminal processing protease CtpA/Prc